jgi:hypothetical protein
MDVHSIALWLAFLVPSGAGHYCRPFECPFASEGARKERLRSQIAPGTEREFPRFSARTEGRIARHPTPIAPDPRLVVGW